MVVVTATSALALLESAAVAMAIEFLSARVITKSGRCGMFSAMVIGVPDHARVGISVSGLDTNGETQTGGCSRG